MTNEMMIKWIAFVVGVFLAFYSAIRIWLNVKRGYKLKSEEQLTAITGCIGGFVVIIAVFVTSYIG